MSRVRHKYKKPVPGIVVTLVWVAVIIAVWEVIATVVAASFPERQALLYFPHLYQIIGLVFSDRVVGNSLTCAELVFPAAGRTLLRALYGFLIGTVLGFILALLMNLFLPVEKIAFPYLMLIQMVPILGMAPVVLAITQDVDKARIVIAAILTFYPVSTNVLAGFKAVSVENHELMYSYNANKFELYVKTLIPSSVPFLFTGLKIAAPMAVTAAVLVDTLQGDGGLGVVLSQAVRTQYTAREILWVCIFLSGIVGVLSFSLMGVLEKLFTPQVRARLFKRRGKA